jgi:hypothetical protein
MSVRVAAGLQTRLIGRRLVRPVLAAGICVLTFAAIRPIAAQQPPATPNVADQQGPQTPGAQGQRGRGGRGGPAVPAGPARQTAPVDLTGNWVSVVTEDWQWRMVTAKKGDYSSVPLTPAGRAEADKWTEANDGQCQAYGVGGIMRMPGRLRISWQDDNTLKIETDAGEQTRLLRFAPVGAPGAAAAPVSAQGPRTLQGTSLAEWQRSGGAFDAFLERGGGAGPARRWGSLKVVTTNHTGGWLRRNGVPYSQNAVITEYYTRISNPEGGDWFVVTTVVEDPQYLGQPFITSSNFKKEADGAKFKPAACKPA